MDGRGNVGNDVVGFGTTQPPSATRVDITAENKEGRGRKRRRLAVMVEEAAMITSSFAKRHNERKTKRFKSNSTTATISPFVRTTKTFQAGSNISNSNKKKEEESCGIQLLPMNVIVACILPLLDRISWNQFMASYRELYLEVTTKRQTAGGGRRFHPPWPKTLLRSTNNASCSISPNTNTNNNANLEVKSVSFSVLGDLLACEMLDSSFSKRKKFRIRIYHQISGLYTTIEDGHEPRFSPIETILAFRRITLTNNNTRAPTNITTSIQLWNHNNKGDDSSFLGAGIVSLSSATPRGTRRGKIRGLGGRKDCGHILGFHHKGTLLFLSGCQNSYSGYFMTGIRMLRIRDGVCIHTIQLKGVLLSFTNFKLSSTTSPTMTTKTSILVSSTKPSSMTASTAEIGSLAVFFGSNLYLTDLRYPTCAINAQEEDANNFTFSREFPDDCDLLDDSSNNYHSTTTVTTTTTTTTSVRITIVEFSPHGKYLACGRSNGNIHLWNVPNRSLERVLSFVPQNPICSICFSPILMKDNHQDYNKKSYYFWSSTVTAKKEEKEEKQQNHLILAASTVVTTSDDDSNDNENNRNNKTHENSSSSSKSSSSFRLWRIIEEGELKKEGSGSSSFRSINTTKISDFPKYEQERIQKSTTTTDAKATATTFVSFSPGGYLAFILDKGKKLPHNNNEQIHSKSCQICLWNIGTSWLGKAANGRIE